MPGLCGAPAYKLKERWHNGIGPNELQQQTTADADVDSKIEAVVETTIHPLPMDVDEANREYAKAPAMVVYHSGLETRE